MLLAAFILHLSSFDIHYQFREITVKFDCSEIKNAVLMRNAL